MHPSSTPKSLDGLVAGSAARKRAMLLTPTARPMHLSKLSLANKTLSITIQKRKDGSTRRTLMETLQPSLYRHHPKVRLQEWSVQLDPPGRAVVYLRQCLHFLRRLLRLSMLLGRRSRTRRYPSLHLSIRHEVPRQP